MQSKDLCRNFTEDEVLFFIFWGSEGVMCVVLPLVASGLVWIYVPVEKCELNEDERGDESMFFINAD